MIINANILQVFANPEDIKLSDGATVDYANAEVERVRRCHQVCKNVKISSLQNIENKISLTFRMIWKMCCHL